MTIGALIAMLIVAAVIAACIFGLVRTSGARDKRVVGPPIPGDELTQHERDTALMNLTTMNQQATLMEAQRSFGS